MLRKFQRITMLRNYPYPIINALFNKYLQIRYKNSLSNSYMMKNQFSTKPRSYAGEKTRNSYKHPSKIQAIIRSNSNEIMNQEEKQFFYDYVKQASTGLYKNYNKTTQTLQKHSNQFMTDLCKSLDSQTFAKFLSNLDQLKANVLQNNNHTLTPQSFFPFLDSLKKIGVSQEICHTILSSMKNININMIERGKLLKLYQANSVQANIEQTLRINEIKFFAKDVVPSSRFIFDNYSTNQKDTKTQIENKSKEEKKENDRDIGLNAKSLNDSAKRENYFSHFQSQEAKIEKPEGMLKTIDQMMSFLPLDYYVLLEQDSGRKNDSFSNRSNCIYFRNLPLIYQKKTILNKYKMCQGTFGDVIRPIFQNDQVFSIRPSFNMMKDVLQQQFGQIFQMFTLNFSQEGIKKRVNKMLEKANHNLINNSLKQFQDLYQSVVDGNKSDLLYKGDIQDDRDSNKYSSNSHNKEQFDQKSFTQLIKVIQTDQRLTKHHEANVNRNKKNADYSYNLNTRIEEKLQEIQQKSKKDPLKFIKNNLNEKLQKRYGLNKPILTNGIIFFKDYSSKLKMMSSPLFKFGNKFIFQCMHVFTRIKLGLYHFFNNVEFYDGDFANLIAVRSQYFQNKTLKQCKKLLNDILIAGDYMREKKNTQSAKLLTVGELKHYPDFNLQQIKINSSQPILLRFRNFHSANRAQRSFFRGKKAFLFDSSRSRMFNSEERKKFESMTFTLQAPVLRYFGGKFQTHFQKCIFDRFVGLDETMSIQSNYVQQRVSDTFGSVRNLQRQFLQKIKQGKRRSNQGKENLDEGAYLNTKKINSFFPKLDSDQTQLKKKQSNRKSNLLKIIDQKSQQKDGQDTKTKNLGRVKKTNKKPVSTLQELMEKKIPISA